MRVLRSALLVCGALACAAAARHSFALLRAHCALADSSPRSLRAALTRTPTNATLWRRLGIALLETDKPAATAALGRAVELNPHDADALLGLAFLAESNGRLERAESLYDQASAASRRFQPRYARAAYYLRRGQLDRFWPAASKAADTELADVGRIFKAAYATGVPRGEVMSRLKLETAHSLSAYARFALENAEYEQAAAAALRLSSTPQHRPLLRLTAERLADAGWAREAVAVWNHSGPPIPLDPASGRSLTQPYPTSQEGVFDWWYPKNAGVITHPAGDELRIELSGEHPQQCSLVRQIVPVVAGQSYSFSARMSAENGAPGTGLTWHADCFPSRARLASQAAASPERLIFRPNQCELVALTLEYSRQPGTRRAPGAFRLAPAKLDVLP